jgi:hypothetical protein
MVKIFLGWDHSVWEGLIDAQTGKVIGKCETISEDQLDLLRIEVHENFFVGAVSINFEKRCNHYRLIVACMLSGVRPIHPEIVGWSTAPRGRVINESLGQVPKKHLRPRNAPPHGSTSCDRAFQRSTGVHGLLQFLRPVFVLSRRNPPIVFGIWIAK